MNGPNSGKDVFIPLNLLIGGKDMLGKGWMMLMNCLSVGRSISLPAVGTGAAKYTSLVTGQYTRIREQFNVPLAAFEGIQESLARIGGNAWLMDSARLLTAQAVDLGEKPSVLSAILKYHLTERGRECIRHAMDVHGGKGIIMGPNNYLGRNWQGAPIFITVEGANILSRNLMIFGQGAIRCHPFVLKEMALAGREDHEQALDEFDDLLMKHIMFAAGNAASTLVLGLGLGLIEKAPGDALSQGYFRALNRQAAAFALLADLSMMLLGGALKRRERLSARLGDVLSHLYLSSAALKRYHDLGSPEHMQPLLRWAMEESLASQRAPWTGCSTTSQIALSAAPCVCWCSRSADATPGQATSWMPKLQSCWVVAKVTQPWSSYWLAASGLRQKVTRWPHCNAPAMRWTMLPRCTGRCLRQSRTAPSSRRQGNARLGQLSKLAFFNLVRASGSRQPSKHVGR
ncbi:hypothetical protein PspTeo4_01936 [Pseudomonas sp. Teo4]|nr:hypothetical protein [Pseudomonas sp. Teo4]